MYPSFFVAFFIKSSGFGNGTGIAVGINQHVAFEAGKCGISGGLFNCFSFTDINFRNSSKITLSAFEYGGLRQFTFSKKLTFEHMVKS